MIARSPAQAALSCYNSSIGADAAAPLVAQQIVSANCGTYNKCVVVTHSMGGLVIEHILTHARAALPSDPDATLFSNSALYIQAKMKILSVISIASAAGGAQTATMLEGPGQTGQSGLAILIANLLGYNSDATKSLVVSRAADVLAPIQADPGIPIYMVPGYTAETATEAGIAGNLAVEASGQIPLQVYQSDPDFTALDPLVTLTSRSDGMIEFRSSCGVASDNPSGGPGYSASLTSQLSYCYSSPKKTNHFVWFLTNLNHSLSPTPWNNCANTTAPCQILEANAAQATYTANASLSGQSAINVIRAKLDINRAQLPPSGQSVVSFHLSR